VTSDRKREANKMNARLSSGPRTQAGKTRSRANARRHGLATVLGDDPDQRHHIERLVAVLSNRSNDPSFVAQARSIAECHLDLHRIRTAQQDALHQAARAETIGELESALFAIEKFHRYFRRALSKRKTTLKSILDRARGEELNKVDSGRTNPPDQ
jgi:hypothetical protein